MPIEIDPIKVASIMDWPTPIKVKEVQSFLGFCNFYCRFIKDYLKIAKPLFELTQKEHSWDWTLACKEAFQMLKTIFTESLVLIMLDTRTPSTSNVMPPTSPPEQYYHRLHLMENGTPMHIFPNHSHLWNTTTQSMTKNC